MFALLLAWSGLWWRGIGPLPPLIRLFDVTSGLWRHTAVERSGPQTVPGLKSPVTVTWDKAGVPHFFAASEEDLYRAQGYIMASQRLFQMDLASRQMAGRLSEWVGAKTADMDRFFIRFGMRDLARARLEKYWADPVSRRMMESFVAGVNAYIDSARSLPPEYYLLGVKPERFEPLRVIYMAESMTWSLSSRSRALELTRLQQALGVEKVLELFPEFLPRAFEDFIYPTRTGGGSARSPEKPENFTFVSHLREIPDFPLGNPRNGSNNWAVGPAKSVSRRSILANDTHLNYSLPNVWYENQLSCPGFNVYGVGLVSIPGIVNGFNAQIAWGPTNGTTSVLDWYEIEFENETSLRYRHNKRWAEAELHREKLQQRGVPSKIVDVVWTRLGPLVHREGRYGLVAAWAGAKPGQELRALRGLYSAATAEACRQSFADWSVPIQNFICADGRHISMRHTGFVPRRKVGEGRFIMDGNNASDVFTESVPEELHPQSIDPAQGFVLSANQKAMGPDYPFYLGWDYEEPYRGMQIRRRLKEKDRFTAQDFMDLQNDHHDLQAEFLLPRLLPSLNETGLNPAQRDLVSRLRRWDFDVRGDSVEAVLFKAWLKEVNDNLFVGDIEAKKPAIPKTLRTAWLIQRLTSNPKDADARWLEAPILQWAQESSSHPQRRFGEAVAEVGAAEEAPLVQLVTRSFIDAWIRLTQEFGDHWQDWTWQRFNRAQLRHVARLDGFGTPVLPMDGSGQSVSGNHGYHGPVYKAVIELTEPPRAWMEVPGGNEGDPFSPHYGKRVEEWARGRLREVEYYPDVEEARRRAVAVTELEALAAAQR